MLLVLLEPVPDVKQVKLSRLTSEVQELGPRLLDERDKQILELIIKVPDTLALSVCQKEDAGIMKIAYAKGITRAIAAVTPTARSLNKLSIAKAIAAITRDCQVKQIVARSGIVPYLLKWLLNFDIETTSNPIFVKENTIYLCDGEFNYKTPSAMQIAKAASKTVEYINIDDSQIATKESIITVSRTIL